MNTDLSCQMLPFREHEMRRTLVAELHARPAMPVSAPAQIIRFAFYHGSGDRSLELDHLNRLYQAHDVTPREALPLYEIVSLQENLVLRYERHTEFSTYALVKSGDFDSDHPFEEDLTRLFPENWLEDAPAQVIGATRIALEKQGTRESTVQAIGELFNGNPLIGSIVAGGKIRHWTDINLHGDGFSRHLMELSDVSETQAGRAIQRILEIGTYCQMALLGLPEARRAGPLIAAIESELGVLAAELAKKTETREGREDEVLLTDLTALAVRIEHIQTETTWRFSASRAYHQLITARFQELRQERVEGVPNLSESLERRLTPAMRTCESVDGRIKDLALRISRLTGLLRARVTVERANQNQQLLQNMDKSASQQLMLQRTVEGLSTVAITYYALGLVGYVAKAGKAIGLPMDPAVVTGLAVLPVGGLVWWGLRRMTHKMLTKQDS